MRGRSQRGYTLVVLIVAITVMNIAVATALPLWSTAIQREKEEELIFRGLQYAEAIRVFRQRHGRLPFQLEELLKVEPRSIRQLWADPMTESGKWGIVAAQYPDRGEQGGQDLVPDGHPGKRPVPPGWEPTEEQKTPPAPIRGVFSKSKESSIKLFFGRTRYDQWKFTHDLITNVGQKPAALERETTSRRGQGLRLSVKWLGRPFRPGIDAEAIQVMIEQPTGLPGSSLETTGPDGKPVGDKGRGGGRRRPGGGGRDGS